MDQWESLDPRWWSCLRASHSSFYSTTYYQMVLGALSVLIVLALNIMYVGELVEIHSRNQHLNICYINIG
jgi:hypothetical protein